MLTFIEDLSKAEATKARAQGWTAFDPVTGCRLVRTMVRQRWSEREYILYDNEGKVVKRVFALSDEEAVAMIAQ